MGRFFVQYMLKRTLNNYSALNIVQGGKQGGGTTNAIENVKKNDIMDMLN